MGISLLQLLRGEQEFVPTRSESVASDTPVDFRPAQLPADLLRTNLLRAERDIKAAQERIESARKEIAAASKKIVDATADQADTRKIIDSINKAIALLERG